MYRYKIIYLNQNILKPSDYCQVNGGGGGAAGGGGGGVAVTSEKVVGLHN